MQIGERISCVELHIPQIYSTRFQSCTYLFCQQYLSQEIKSKHCHKPVSNTKQTFKPQRLLGEKQKNKTKEKILNWLSLSPTHVSVSDLGHKFHYISVFSIILFYFGKRVSFCLSKHTNLEAGRILKIQMPIFREMEFFQS